MNVDDISTLIESILYVVQIIAIIIAGLWTYILFIRNRQNFPKLQISHKVLQKRTDRKNVLFHIAVVIENKGSVLAKIEEGNVKLLQVLPLIEKIKEDVSNDQDPVNEKETQIVWYQIGLRRICKTYEIEPGENEEIHCDFIVESGITTVQIYSYFENSSKKNNKPFGWNCTTFHDIDV